VVHAFHWLNMTEKGPLEELLKAWKTPSPRDDFEANILRRLHAQPVRESPWQRWFVEPLEQASGLWRQQALTFVGMAVLALAVGIGVIRIPNETTTQESNQPQPPLGLNAFSSFPEGSVTMAYRELVKR